MKKLALFLLPLLLLALFSGCRHTNPHKESDYTLPQLSEERQAEIEAAWAQRKQAIAPDAPEHFYEPGSGQDALRYYGSYSTPSGSATVDIFFVPYDTLSVPTKVSMGGITFRHRTAFCIYYYCSGRFYDLKGDYLGLGEDTLPTVFSIHKAYEEFLYGSMLTELPKWDSSTLEKRFMGYQATTFAQTGFLRTTPLEQDSSYYGNFEGYDVFLESGLFDIDSGLTIAGEEFRYGSPFTIWCYKDLEYEKLEVLYEAGKISQEAISQLADLHYARYSSHYH